MCRTDDVNLLHLHSPARKLGRSPSPPTLVGGSSTEDTEDDGDGIGGGSDVDEDSPQWQVGLIWTQIAHGGPGVDEEPAVAELIFSGNLVAQ
eukprot:scaffold75461_cov19-Tisochrysis_lutea.AAC.1